MRTRIRFLGPFLSPFGAALALVCFFLPWGEVSCFPVHITRTGAQIGGPLWLVFGAAIAILAAAAIFPCLPLLGPRIGRARCLAMKQGIMLVAALVGIVGLIATQIRLAAGYGTILGRIRPSDLGAEIGIGGPGTVIGMVIALGASLLPFLARRNSTATDLPARMSTNEASDPAPCTPPVSGSDRAERGRVGDRQETRKETRRAAAERKRRSRRLLKMAGVWDGARRRPKA
ncbi:MAG: hypothetical protein KBD56_08570 [Candidatus Eisenbacteria bacterium]|nr:hypothetical protein [Candidatus Eisenbacteria bacterium]